MWTAVVQIEALRRALQRLHAPLGGVLHVHVEGGFIELDDVHAVGLQGQRLLVEQLGEDEGHLDLVAIEAIGDRVDNRHRPGQRELELALRVRPRELRLEGMDPALEFQRRDHLRHHRVVAVVADAHLHLVLEIDAFDLLQEPVHEMLARLLAITDDVQARVFLGLDPQQGGIGLGLAQFVALGVPPGPQLPGFGQPGRLGQAARDGGGEHGTSWDAVAGAVDAMPGRAGKERPAASTGIRPFA